MTTAAVLAGLLSSPVAQAAVQYDKVVALVVGVNGNALKNAEADARAFAQVMKNRRWSGRKTKLLTLYGKQATRSRILASYRKAIDLARGDRSLLVFYFAGYGRATGTEGFLVPHGAGEDDTIAMSRLRSLAKADNGITHQLFIIGSCFSGLLFRDEPVKTEAVLRRQKQAVDWFAASLEKVVRRGITAGAADEVVPDGEPGKGSAFGQAVVRAFQKRLGSDTMLADINGDACVSDDELAAYVRSNGRDRWRTSPSAGPLAGDDYSALAGFCDRAFADSRSRLPVTGAVRDVPKRTAHSSPLSVFSIPLGMVHVPAGPFLMGCNRKVDKHCADDEKPLHEVHVDAFYIDATEVTADAYRRCVKAGRCEKPKTGGACTYEKKGFGKHPINCVNWDQATAYCQWTNRRLPTEAEWEKAARGTDGRVYPWGNEGFGQTKVANIADETAKKADSGYIYADGYDDGFAYTSPVGSFPAGKSPFGAYDMSGNVWEWTSSKYDKSSFTIRGGSRGTHLVSTRASYRLWRGVAFQGNDLGFRCIQSQPSVP